MKLINQYRSTKSFCIGSGHVDSLSRILEWAKAKDEMLIAVANDPQDDSRYTVRCVVRTFGRDLPAGSPVVKDYRLTVSPWRSELDRAVIVDETYAVTCASGTLTGAA